MKSLLKYSTTSKIKKQNQEQKQRNSHSVLNTLKQDDEITSNLLDTLNQDYIEYLEDLMGKQSSQNHIPASHQKISAKSTSSHNRYPSINEHLSKDSIESLHEGESPTQSNSILQLIPQKDQSPSSKSIQLQSSIVKVEPTPKQSKAQDDAKPQAFNHLKQEKVKKISLLQPQKSQTFQKEISKKQQKKTYLEAKTEQSNQKHDRYEKSKDKSKLIHNIEGYLESLTAIKPQKQHMQNVQPKQNRRKSKSVSNHPQIISLESKVQKKKKKQPSRHFAEDQKGKEKQGKDKKDPRNEIYINPFEKDPTQTKIQPSKPFEKSERENSHKQKQKNYDTRQMFEHSSRELSASSSLSQDNSSDQESLLSKNDIERYMQKKKRKSHHEQGSTKYHGSLQKTNDSSLEQLLIKIITKYNKLLTKYNKEKKKNQILDSECSKLKIQNQTKDIQISTLKQLHQDLFQNPGFSGKGLKNLDFLKKQKLSYNQANEESLRNTQFTENDFRKKDHSQREELLVQSKNVQKARSLHEKQKRSVSWRQNSKKMLDDNPGQNHLNKMNETEKVGNKNEIKFSKTVQDKIPKNIYQFSTTLPNQSGEIKKNKVLYEGFYTHQQKKSKNDLKDKISQAGQYSARKRNYNEAEQDEEKNFKIMQNKWNKLQNQEKHSDIVSIMMERDRSYSESYNSLSFKRKSMNDMKYKFMKDNYEPEHQEPAKYHWKHKLNQRQNQSVSDSESDQKFQKYDQNIQQNLQYFAKSIRGSTSDHYFKKDPPFYNEESQSTDSELLEKLLSIHKNSNSLTGKNPGNRKFFK